MRRSGVRIPSAPPNPLVRADARHPEPGRQHGHSAFTPRFGPSRAALIAPSRALSSAPGRPRTPESHEDREDPRHPCERSDPVARRQCLAPICALGPTGRPLPSFPDPRPARTPASVVAIIGRLPWCWSAGWLARDVPGRGVVRHRRGRSWWWSAGRGGVAPARSRPGEPRRGSSPQPGSAEGGALRQDRCRRTQARSIIEETVTRSIGRRGARAARNTVRSSGASVGRDPIR